MNEAVKKRQAIQRKIAQLVIQAGIKDGYSFEIDNGGDDDEIIKTITEQKTLAAMFATDEERLYFIKDGKRRGWVYFVYGNDGWDVICGYTINLEAFLADTLNLVSLNDLGGQL